ncbi:hypothetical protein KRMM14A1004_37630 [Krasilnikovia sp. MM14-A1004]
MPVVLADGPADPIQLPDRQGDRGGGQHEEELLTAESGRETFRDSGGQSGVQELRDLDEYLIAGVVGELVVDPLEVVDVDDRHTQVRVCSDHGGQFFVDIATVAQSGEWVAAGLLAEAVGFLPGLGGLEPGEPSEGQRNAGAASMAATSRSASSRGAVKFAT